MSSDFYATSIAPFAPIIIKICRAYTNTQEDFEDYYQEVCLQIWRSQLAYRALEIILNDPHSEDEPSHTTSPLHAAHPRRRTGRVG